MQRKDTVVIGLLGAAVGLLLVLTMQLGSVRGAQGQTAGATDSGWILATGTVAGNSCVCFLFDTKQSKLGMYQARGAKGFEWSGMRLVTHDFAVIEYPAGQRPSVEEASKMGKDKDKKK